MDCFPLPMLPPTPRAQRAADRAAAVISRQPSVVVDRVVTVIRRHVLADLEPSAWSTAGLVAAAAIRIAGLVLLYCLRFALARSGDGPGIAPDGAGRRSPACAS